MRCCPSRLLVLTAFLSASLSSPLLAEPSVYRFSVPKGYYGSVWGMVDSKGHLVGELNYQRLVASSHGNPDVKRYVAHLPNQQYRYLDAKGQPLVESDFEAAKTFTDEGLARYQQGALWGYINLEGKSVIPAAYQYASYFSHGLAAVKKNGTYAYIDTQENVVIAGPFQEAEAFSASGLAAVKPVGEALFGYINRTGEWVIEPQFIEAKPFNEDGIAAVEIPNTASELKNLWHFFNGDLKNVKSDTPWGAIDEQGQWLIKPVFKGLSSFTNGLAVAETTDGHWIVNTKGEPLERSYTREVRFYPHCNLLKSEIDPELYDFDLAGYEEPNGASISWLASLNEHCQGIARLNKQWGIWDQKNSNFTPFPDRYNEPLRRDYLWGRIDDALLIPMVRQDHVLEYITLEGRALFSLKNDDNGYLIAVSPEGNVLWKTPFQEEDYFPFRLEPDNDAIGFDEAWLSNPDSLLDALSKSTARLFDPSAWDGESLFINAWSEEDKEALGDEGYPFGQVILLAEERITETDIAGFPYKEQEERIHAIYNQMAKVFITRLGHPLSQENGEAIWDTWDSVSKVWQKDGHYVVLQHSKIWGDSETMETLLLIKMSEEQMTAYRDAY